MTDDIVARLSALPEDRALDCFWMMHRDGADPLELLQQFGQVRVWRPRGWSPKEIRRQYEELPIVFADGSRCFGCSNSRRIVAHHIIQIQHGGSNDLRNIVPVCFNCHKRLHPWLEETRSRRGFEWVRDIMPRVIDRLWRRSA